MCGSKCLKVMLMVINILFFLAGAAVLGVGIWIRVDKSLENFRGPDTGLEDFRNALNTSAYVLIAFGAFTFLVGFCGCCGAMKNNKVLLGIYIFCVAVVLGAEIAGGVYGYVKQDSLIESLSKVGKDYLREKYNDTASEGAAWNFVMVQMSCCGVKSYKDFENSAYTNSTKKAVPPACCKQRKSDTGEGGPVDYNACKLEAGTGIIRNQLNSDGCEQKIKDFVKKNAAVILGVAGGVAGLELLVLIVAIAYCCVMDKDDY